MWYSYIACQLWIFLPQYQHSGVFCHSCCCIVVQVSLCIPFTVMIMVGLQGKLLYITIHSVSFRIYIQLVLMQSLGIYPSSCCFVINVVKLKQQEKNSKLKVQCSQIKLFLFCKYSVKLEKNTDMAVLIECNCGTELLV